MLKNEMNINENKVSNTSKENNIDVSKIEIEVEETKENNDEYKKFCDKYTRENFEKYKVKNLKYIYEIGNGLLNQYFITKNDTCDNNILIQLNYIISNVMYNINIKQVNSANQKNQALSKKLENIIKKAQTIEKDADKKNNEINHVKNDIKSIMTTIISIILTISIIPTAITGIQYISPNYILPFLSSVILFGIIMIMFIYSIYQDKLKISTWIILFIAFVICIVFWYSSFLVNITC